VALTRVAAFSGGVGGARLIDGLARLLPDGQLTVIVNTGDDFDHLGLRICPDLDTVLYTLAGLADPRQGWGRDGESWTVLETLQALGGPDWFRLGDRDVALHLLRTHLLAQGLPLSGVTALLCERLGVGCTVLPMTDDRVSTRVLTLDDELAFQEYFVARRCEPEVRAFRFAGISEARPAPGVVEAIDGADVVVFGPSNPWVSLDPILAVPGIREALAGKPVIAVTPIIGGQALKGPAAKMFAELGIMPAAAAVAEHYHDLLTGFVMDIMDEDQVAAVESAGIQTLITDTIMKDRSGRKRLAQEVLAFAGTQSGKEVFSW